MQEHKLLFWITTLVLIQGMQQLKKTRNGINYAFQRSHNLGSRNLLPAKKKRSKYLNDLVEETVRIKQSKGTNDTAFILPEVPKNIAPMPKPDKNEAIKSMRTLFNVEED